MSLQGNDEKALGVSRTFDAYVDNKVDLDVRHVRFAENTGVRVMKASDMGTKNASTMIPSLNAFVIFGPPLPKN